MKFSPVYHSPFQQFVKKQHKPLKAAVEDAVEEVLADPSVGEFKKGDLQGVQVFKFKFQRVEYLMAYRMPAFAAGTGAANLEIELLAVDFYKVGSHENFYEELKRYLKSMKG